MKRAALVVAMVTAAAMAYAMEFALTDGTVVSGEIEGDISVRASFGTFNLSGEAIVSIELGDPAKIELEDGSTIVAQILGETLSVRWAYGVIELAIADIALVGGVRSAGGGGPTFAGSLETAFVAGGTFQMGSTGGDSDESPVHTVTVDGFHMTLTEITFEQYDAFAHATGSRVPGDEGWGRGGMPVINVSWYDAVAYANWLSAQDGLTPAYRIDGLEVTWNRDADGWRLPTEAEWEFAARGGVESRLTRYAGGTNLDEVAWYIANYDGRTHPAGQKQPNELGLYDMSGNVWEWVWDWYGGYSRTAQTNPVGPASGSSRVVRGGSWNIDATHARVANRSRSNPSGSVDNYGFRLARPAVQ